MRYPALPAALLALVLTGAAPATRAETEAPKLPTLELSAEGSAEAANDLAVAQAYFEASDSAPGVLAAEVNRVIAEALKTASAHPQVKVRSAGSHTAPVYSRNGKTIEAWRMRSSLLLESRDMEALSLLMGKLQTRLAIGSVSFSPSPDTRKSAQDSALVRALGNFEARAALAAKTLGKRHQLRQLNISHDSGRPPGMPMYRAAMASAEAAPAPIEAGESTLTVTVNGVVELLD